MESPLGGNSSSDTSSKKERILDRSLLKEKEGSFLLWKSFPLIKRGMRKGEKIKKANDVGKKTKGLRIKVFLVSELLSGGKRLGITGGWEVSSRNRDSLGDMLLIGGGEDRKQGGGGELLTRP